jgi:D-alanyl-D-alanine carboxypeptidase
VGLEAIWREAELDGEAAVAAGAPVWETPGAAGRRGLVYSITKTFLAVVVLRLGVVLDARIRAVFDDSRLPDATLRQLLDHTSGVPDYGRQAAYAEAVRTRPDRAWSDEELLAAALAEPPAFRPGEGWDYSNTGYLLVRRLVDRQAPGGFAATLAAEILQPLGLEATELVDGVVELPTGERYDTRWVGHRTLVSTANDQLRFWLALAAGELVPLDELTAFTSIGAEAPGFVRPGYGLGVMSDPDHPDGLLLGHGGGGPGYAAGAFAIVRDGRPPAAAVVLAADERAAAQETALRLLAEAAVRIR